MSVPVLQKTKNKWYGFVDVWDIVRDVVQEFGTSNGELLRNTDDWFKLVSAHQSFQDRTVADIMKNPLTRSNPFHPFHSGYSFFSVVEALAKEPQLHRVPVITNDEERKLVTVVTQSQVLKLLHQNMDGIGSKLKTPVMKFRSYFEPVVCVHEDSVAYEAFTLMVQKKITGVGVINNEGTLTGVLSVRDIKAIMTDGRMFWRLYQTCKNFILKIKKEDTGDRPRSPLTVQAEDTLGTTIKKLVEHNIHRVFIVDDNKKPVGVVALRDILFEILH